MGCKTSFWKQKRGLSPPTLWTVFYIKFSRNLGSPAEPPRICTYMSLSERFTQLLFCPARCLFFHNCDLPIVNVYFFHVCFGFISIIVSLQFKHKNKWTLSFKNFISPFKLMEMGNSLLILIWEIWPISIILCIYIVGFSPFRAVYPLYYITVHFRSIWVLGLLGC